MVRVPRSRSWRWARALCWVVAVPLLLSGCLWTDTPVIPVDLATTPLEPGRYVAKTDPPLPAVESRTDYDVRLDGIAYSVWLLEPGKLPTYWVTGYLVKVAADRDIYLLQIPVGPLSAPEVPTEKPVGWITWVAIASNQEFCTKWPRRMPAAIVATDPDIGMERIRSNAEFLQWIRDNAERIALETSGRCLFRLG